MRSFRLTRVALVATLASMAAVCSLIFAGSAAAAQAYGISVSKGCISPIDVGDAYTCTAELDNNNSVSQDTVRVTSLTDDVNSSTGVHSTTMPINSSTPGLQIFSLGGNLSPPTCDATGCSLPYNTGLSVTFSHYTTVIGDFPFVSDTATFDWNDLCLFIAPGTACSVSGQHNQSGASANINPLPTTTTTSISSGGNGGVTVVAAGSSVTDSVTVAAPANQPPPTGSVTVNFYSTIDCTGNAVDAATNDALDANGQALNVHPEGPLAAGVYSYQAVYPGNGPYSGSTGACEPLHVVDANIQVTPATASNEIGTNHVLTGHVSVNDGSGVADAPDGTVIDFSLSNAGGASATFVGPSSCTTGGGTGSCTVTISSPTTGTTTIHDTTTVSVGGIALTRASGDGLAGDSADANKTWVDANIQITPANATNEIGTNHTLTGHVNVDAGAGAGVVNAPAGTSITFAIVSGPGGFVGGVNTCTTVAATGECTVQITSSTTGVTVVNAATDVVLAGIPVHRATADGKAGDSADANKTWVDANIQITPANATNPTGTNHVLTGHVNVNDGAGFVNAPDGTVINFSLTNAGGATATFVGPSSCTTTGGTGSCTVVISSPTAGTTTIRDTTTVSVLGTALTRSSGDGLPGDSSDATKLWVTPPPPPPPPAAPADDSVRTDILDANGTVITSAVSGAVVRDKVYVSRSSATPAGVANPTGNVVFHRFGTVDCTGASTDETVALTPGSPSTALSSTFAPTSDMSYRADYLGDSSYPAHSGACEPLKVSPAAAPSIAIVKNPKSQTVAVGGTAKFAITVTNTGNTVLTNVTVTDPLSPNCDRTSAQIPALASMAPGAAVTYSCSRPNVRSNFTNTATATGTPPSGPNVTASDTAPVKTRALKPPKVKKKPVVKKVKKKPKVISHRKPVATG